MKTGDQQAMIGIVAIGRNEGERLKRCLESLKPFGHLVVYVDSGSTDDSVTFARSNGAEVVELDMSIPFTAARARNAGADRLKELSGDALEYIQFVDGDCEVIPDWIDNAVAALEENPKTAVVAGRRRERFPDATIYNRYCDMEWNTPIGTARAVGGDALYRRAAFDAVGGFDPSFICGEEPELCYRLRQQGWQAVRIDHDMTLHDAAMTKWSEYWKRATRSGWAYAEGAATYGDGPEAYNVAEQKRGRFWGGVVPAILFACITSTFLLALIGNPLALLTGFASFAIIGLYMVLALKTAYGRRKSHKDPWADSLIYGGLVTIGKLAQFQGQRRYYAIKDRGEVATIIEYKSGTENAS